jgi:hypothetical protein
MFRLPDRLFRPLDRLVVVQRRIRQREAEARLVRENAVVREYFARQLAKHEAGTCGGASAGCGYVPCVPRV